MQDKHSCKHPSEANGLRCVSGVETGGSGGSMNRMNRGTRAPGGPEWGGATKY